MKFWEENGLKIGIKDSREIAAMREGGKILGEILFELQKFTREGVQCDEINDKAENLMRQFKVIPSFKGYQGFPATVCACVNEQVVHCIPGPYRLKNGDIISIDCGVYHLGFHTDRRECSKTDQYGGKSAAKSHRNRQARRQNTHNQLGYSGHC